VADLDDLLTRLARGLARGVDAGLPLPDRLCRAAVDLLGCDGGALTMAYTRVERVTLCATDATAMLLEETQDVVGQGPGPDAFTTGTYSRFDLVDVDGPDPRWPLLDSGSLTTLAPLVVHAVPMGEGEGSVVGVLTLYQNGVDRDIDLDAALVVGRVVAAALLADGPSMHESGQGPWSERAEVHQATGMVVAQLGVPEQDALALLRAHAYSHDQSVGTTAHAVITRQLAFSANPEQEIEST
jgi:hypothetical protein